MLRYATSVSAALLALPAFAQLAPPSDTCGTGARHACPVAQAAGVVLGPAGPILSAGTPAPSTVNPAGSLYVNSSGWWESNGAAWYSANPGGSFNVRAYGATGNGIALTGVTTTASSTTVCATSHTFVATDIGKLIAVPGAATVVTIGNPAGYLDATVSSISAGCAVVSAAANVSIGGTGTATLATDDTTAIQAAITAAGNNGGTVYFPPGVYGISASLTPYSNVSYHGDGAGKSVLKWVAPSAPSTSMLYSISGSAGSPWKDVQITGIEFDMEAAVTSGYQYASKALYLQYMVRPYIAGNYFHGAQASCLGIDYLQGGAIVNNMIANCGRSNTTFAPGGAGIGVATVGTWNEGTVIEGNIVWEPSFAAGTFGIFLEGQSASAVTQSSFNKVVNNTIFLGGSNQIGIGCEVTANCQIAGNSILGANYSASKGLRLGPSTVNGTTAPAGTQAIIAGNRLQATHIGIYYLDAQTNTTVPNDVLIASNLIEGCDSAGVYISTGSTQLDSFHLQGNLIKLNGGPGLYVSGTAGVKNLKLDGNFIANNATSTGTANQKAGLSITSPVAGLYMTGNTFYDNNTSTQLYAIIGDGASTAISAAHIVGNELNGATGAISLTNSATLAGYVALNKGFNPVGSSSVSPTASPWVYTAGNVPGTLHLYGGTISSVVQNSITLATASPTQVHLLPGESVTVTYSVAPTAAFNGE